MSTIMKSLVEKPPSGEVRLRFSGVPFGTYESLIRATPERTAIRMAYDGKDLEIMVTGPVHDDYGWFLDRFINVVARAVGIRRRALGKTTWIRPEIERGIEADQCYVFDPAKLATVGELLARKENDVTGYPNPDLAVEVDISRPQADRPAIYAALHVPELWTFNGEVVTIQHLGTDGEYIDAGKSNWIPVTASDATRWLVAEDTDDPDAWEDRLRAWADLLPRAAGGAHDVPSSRRPALRQPFQPFRFVFADNIEVCVRHAEQVKHKPGDRIVVVTYSSGGESIIDLDHVALIEVDKP